MARTSKRRDLLEAAKRVMLGEDLEALTLDRVAQVAGVSKGGLLYHFPSKDALLSGVVSDIYEAMREQMVAHAEADPVEVGRYARAFIRITEEDLAENGELNAALVAHSSLSSDIQKTFSAHYDDLLELLERDPLPEQKKVLIRLTCDGLYYGSLLNIARISEDQQQEVFTYLYGLAGGETE